MAQVVVVFVVIRGSLGAFSVTDGSIPSSALCVQGNDGVSDKLAIVAVVHATTDEIVVSIVGSPVVGVAVDFTEPGHHRQSMVITNC